MEQTLTERCFNLKVQPLDFEKLLNEYSLKIILSISEVMQKFNVTS